jgi:hypothetical protein
MFSPWLAAGQSEGMIDVHTPVGPVNVPSLACRHKPGGQSMSTHLQDLSMFSPWLVGKSEGLIGVHTPARPVNVPSLACRPI